MPDAARAIAAESARPVFTEWETSVFSLDKRPQIRVRLGDRQHCLETARLIRREFEALTVRLERGSVGDRQAALDLAATIQGLNKALNYVKRR